MTDDDELQTESPSSGLGQAIKVAAAAAAIGAAAGAARLIADRNGRQDAAEESPDAEPDEPEAHEAPTDEAEPEPERDEDEQEDEEPLPPAAAHDDEDREPQAEREAEPEDEAEREHEPVAGGTFDQTAEVVRSAREQLTALRGYEPESVSALERTPDGWTVTFEVVELARVPDTTDVMASYELVLDDDANLVRYARIRRYSRSQAEHEDGA